MKIVNAIQGIGMTGAEVDSFLERNLNVQLATIDEMGDPNIQPVWFYHDKSAGDLYVMTGEATKKVQNVRKKPNVYFSIDDENIPYKGVKGKGTVDVINDPKRVVSIVEKVNLKYLGTLDHPIAKMTLENARSGREVLLKIRPKFYSTWDFGKMR